MDGRHARRERGQRAVVNAMFELLQEGKLSPSVEEVGARAGVSVATIFRNHGNLDELSRHAVNLFGERFGALFLIPQIGEGPLDQRIARFCDARLDLYGQIWPLLRFVTVRAAKHSEAADNLDRIRQILAFRTRNVHEAVEALRKQGVEFTNEVMGPDEALGLKGVCCCLDPDGNVVELIEYWPGHRHSRTDDLDSNE